MFLYIPAIFQAILFILSLELLAFYSRFFWLFFAIFLVISFAGFRIVIKKWSFWYLSILFFLSVWTIIHLIDNHSEKHVFILLSSIIYYFLLLGIYRSEKNIKDQTARGIISMVLMASFFLFFSASYGIYLNFRISSWILMLFYFFNVAVLSYQYFTIIERRKKRIVLIYSLILGLAMLEMGWIVNFWPFGYLTTGFILLMFYYILWDLVQSYFLRRLSKKKVFVNLIIFISISTMVLSSSRWLPAI
ncbi:MAG: hypothetical protein PHH24_01010 [Candidatus Moranbacteria bacterium]|jgi:hypothetical protein|nr:hypothetical protein [Candidatus Moranbacteria bacterium]MDD5651889.1 hypothetical protein [Candidatus Moranbacteria bacterium]MDX9855350.1 hypothetical protein [Candidatus Moranbacteria bacterium]